VRYDTKETILVTGAAGFIGSHLVERLRLRRERLLCLDNFDPYYAKELKEQNLRQALDGDDSCFVEGDIRDRALLERLFSRHEITTVIHLAARPGVRASIENPLPYFDINVSGTLALLETGRAFGLRKFIFASSSSVYGENGGAPANEESTACHPLSPYGASKVAAEIACETYSRLCDMTTISVRPFTVYGPRQRPDMAIGRFTKLISEGREVTIYGNGDALRDFTFISDIVSGVEAALTIRLDGYRVFNLGRGEPVSVLQAVRLIEEELKAKAMLRFLPAQIGDPLVTRADISKARASLGYQPTVSIHEGIAQYVRWFREGTNPTLSGVVRTIG